MIEKNGNFVNLADVLNTKTDIEVVIEAIKRLGIWIARVNPIYPESEPSPTLVKYRATNHASNRNKSSEAENLISLLELYKHDVIEHFDPDDEHIQFVKKHLTKTIYGWQEIDITLEFEKIGKEIHPPLITIHSLLFGYHSKKGLNHSQIAWQIERNGIYKYGDYPNYLKISADSFHCATALTGLSAYYAASTDERGGYDPYDSDPESDPTYLFGWPEQEFSKFRGPNDETYVEYLDIFYRLKSRVKASFFKEDLYTLGRILLLSKVSTAMVVWAMEKYGIYGLDNFGRVEYHSLTYVTRGMGLLKLHGPLSRYASSIMKNGVIDLEVLEEEAFSMFGWPKEHLPDFNEFKGNQPIINAPQIAANSSEPKVENTTSIEPEKTEKISAVTEDLYIKTIAGLLWYIQGKTTANQHPDWSSQNKLIENLIDALHRLPGANNTGDYKRLFGKINAQSHLMRTPAEIQDALRQAEDDTNPDT